MLHIRETIEEMCGKNSEGDMGQWNIEHSGSQPILTHLCDQARPTDTGDVLRQDLGGGYVRCERCGEKFLPPSEPGNPRLIMRIKPAQSS